MPLRAAPPGDVDLWFAYDAIECPVLLIRGAESDLLSRDIAEEMTRRGPQATCYEVPGIGHAPSLMSDDQIRVVREFLMANRG